MTIFREWTEREAVHGKQIEEIAAERDYFRESRNEARAELEGSNSARQYLAARLDEVKAERDEARAEAANWKPIGIDACWKDHADTLQKQLDEARAVVETLNNIIDRWMEATFTARDERDSLKGQLDAAEQEIKIARLARPTGRIEALEARVSELEAQAINAQQADAALDQFDATTPWEPSDCISGTPGCYCDSLKVAR